MQLSANIFIGDLEQFFEGHLQRLMCWIISQ